MTIAEQIAKNLLDVGAVQLRVDPPFVWTSGLNTPIYTDNRLVISFPKERTFVVDAMLELIKEKNLEFDVVAGTASAAVPWASFVAQRLDLPMVYIKHKSKGYGTNKSIEGTMEKGARVLIVEDLISTGGSAVRAVQSCRDEYDADVVGVLAIFNYEFKKSKQAFEEAGAPLLELTNFSTLVRTASESGFIEEQYKDVILEWSNDPESWSEAHKQ